MLKAEKDFEEFIELLNLNKIKYMIVGAYALALYASPRNTGDIDIYIAGNIENAQGMMKVLKEFGFENSGIKQEDFYEEGKIIQLGVSPVRIDIMNTIDGVVFEDAYPRIQQTKFGNIVANFISREDLIINKSSSNRKKDIADLEELLKFSD